MYNSTKGVILPLLCVIQLCVLSNQYSASIASRMRRISLPFSAVSRAARRSDLDMKSVS